MTFNKHVFSILCLNSISDNFSIECTQSFECLQPTMFDVAILHVASQRSLQYISREQPRLIELRTFQKPADCIVS